MHVLDTREGRILWLRSIVDGRSENEPGVPWSLGARREAARLLACVLHGMSPAELDRMVPRGPHEWPRNWHSRVPAPSKSH